MCIWRKQREREERGGDMKLQKHQNSLLFLFGNNGWQCIKVWHYRQYHHSILYTLALTKAFSKTEHAIASIHMNRWSWIDRHWILIQQWKFHIFHLQFFFHTFSDFSPPPPPHLSLHALSICFLSHSLLIFLRSIRERVFFTLEVDFIHTFSSHSLPCPLSSIHSPPVYQFGLK